jgi:chorismate synthase
MVAADFYDIVPNPDLIKIDYPVKLAPQVYEQPKTLKEWEVVTNRGAHYTIKADNAEIYNGVFQFYTNGVPTVCMPVANVEYLNNLSNSQKGDLR